MAFFKFVQRHCTVFFFLCIVYIAVAIIISAELDLPDWGQALICLPLNVISWPVALEIRKDKHAYIMLWRMSIALVAVSTLLPVLVLLGR